MSSNQITYDGTSKAWEIEMQMIGVCAPPKGEIWDGFMTMCLRHGCDPTELEQEDLQELLSSFRRSMLDGQEQVWRTKGWMGDEYLQVIYTYNGGQKAINYMKCKIPNNTSEDEFCAWLESEGSKACDEDLGRWVKASCCIYGHGKEGRDMLRKCVVSGSKFDKLYSQNRGKFFPDCRVVPLDCLPVSHPMSPKYPFRVERSEEGLFTDEEKDMIRHTFPTHDGEKTHVRIDTNYITPQGDADKQ